MNFDEFCDQWGCTKWERRELKLWLYWTRFWKVLNMDSETQGRNE